MFFVISHSNYAFSQDFLASFFSPERCLSKLKTKLMLDMFMMDFGFLMNLVWVISIITIVTLVFIEKRHKAKVAAFAIFINSLITCFIAFPSLIGELTQFTFYAGSFLGDITLRIDSLTAWFLFIINFSMVMGGIYGLGFINSKIEKSSKLSLHWILLIIFHLSMIWVCLLQNSFAFLIAWEVMSVSSMLLILFDHNNPRNTKAGLNYLVQMHISGVFLTVGFLWAYFLTGTFGFDALHQAFGGKDALWLFIVFFVGFGLKSEFIPLHGKAPHIYPVTEPHVSGLMSGVVVKLGIYGVFRMISFLSFDFTLLGEIILTVSVLTGLYGILNSSVHRDYTRMLAYCTIENIGIIGIGIGVGMIGIGNGSATMYYLGFGGALLHILNHSLFKTMLFFSAGNVIQQTQTRNMERLGGLMKHMPQTAFFFLVAAIGIGAIPPLNGFVSEFLLYGGLIEGIKTDNLGQVSLLILSFAGLSIIGGLSILTFAKTFGTLFLGTAREPLKEKPREVSKILFIPQYLILVLMLSIAFFPKYYFSIINNILAGFTSSTMGFDNTGTEKYFSVLTGVGLYSGVFLMLIVAVLIVRTLLVRKLASSEQPTWGCGYVAPKSNMQYTGKSFSKPLGKIFGFLLIEKKNYKELSRDEIFPQDRKYASFYHDFFETRFIDVFVKQLLRFSSHLKFIQNGRVQSYVLYGIVFILSILVFTMFNVI